MNNSMELVFLLDRSGSMHGLEADTIGGFNSMIEKLRREDGTCHVTTVLFDDQSRILHDRIPLSAVEPMTERDYFVGGSTALLDTIGNTVHHIAKIHKYAKKEDVPTHTMFVITTDGMENASRRYRSDEIKRLIEEKKALGWEFLFIGANIDAVETASHYGIESDRAVDYCADQTGTAVVFNTLASAVGSVRKNKRLSKAWGAAIQEDCQRRR